MVATVIICFLASHVPKKVMFMNHELLVAPGLVSGLLPSLWLTSSRLALVKGKQEIVHHGSYARSWVKHNFFPINFHKL